MDIETENGLAKAIAIAGGASAVARHFGISPQAVYKWLYKGVLPVKRARGLEQLSLGRITRQDLCPDIYGPLDEDVRPQRSGPKIV